MSYFHDNFRKFRTSSGLLVCANTKVTISDSLAEELLHLDKGKLNNNSDEEEKAGRGSVYYGELRSGERFVLRHYLRGGLAKHISSESYLNLPLSPLRPLLELEILATLFPHGIRVPEPLFSIVEYGSLGFSYTGAIATKEVEGAVNFFENTQTLPIEEQNRISRQAGSEAGKVLKAGIFHRDLHPGNVILNSSGEVVLVDFDKALRFEKSKIANYVEPLKERWERAVKKRQLAESLTKEFEIGLMAELKSVPGNV